MFRPRFSIQWAVEDLLADDRNISRGIRPDPDMVARHFDDGDDDIVGDAEGFVDTAGEDQHSAAFLLWRLNLSQRWARWSTGTLADTLAVG